MLGELLGRGGMAEVFSGYVLGSHGFQKPVAIKRLLPELANDHVFVERLIGEAKLLVGMQHGNIVSVLDLARDGDDVFLVMEFVDGPSLRQLLKARGSRGLSLAVSSYIVQAAAAGLEFAHAQAGGAVIHADISPSNLLLTTSGEVRVADFGIARREGNGAGIVEGKWAYMAPEQARGEPLTPRSDVFALGVVLYELITGQHPFGPRVTADERDSGPIRFAPPRVINAHVPPGLDAICMKALAENARDRYSRMQHMIDALVDERFANGWREGASDLAQAIREISPVGSSTGPRTQVTDRPVTIVTRSLISQSHRGSAPVIAEGVSDSVETMDITDNKGTNIIELPRAKTPVPVPIPSSGARTIELHIGGPAPEPYRAPRPDGTPPDPYNAYRLSAALLPSPELASVHGGSTVSQVMDLREGRSNKWTFAVLGIAAVVGVIAAIAIQLASSRDSAADEAKPLVPIVMPAPPPKPAPAPTIARTQAAPAPAAAPTPAPTSEEPAAVQDEQDDATRDETPRRKVRSLEKPAKKAASGTGYLRVNNIMDSPWASAIVATQRGDVPGAKFELPPGRHTVKLTNPDYKTLSCQVTIVANQTTRLTIDIAERICEPQR